MMEFTITVRVIAHPIGDGPLDASEVAEAAAQATENALRFVGDNAGYTHDMADRVSFDLTVD